MRQRKVKNPKPELPFQTRRMLGLSLPQELSQI